MKLKTRSEQRGAHIHTTVFMTSGEEGDTYQNCGELIMDPTQAVVFLDALCEPTHLIEHEHEGWPP